jgi:pimeloyl-ACP methyl ester carboxylesterase
MGRAIFDRCSTPQKKAGKSPGTIIIAPHFLTEDDVNTHNPGSDVPFWTTDSWKGGDDSLSTSTNPRAAHISSFEVVDVIMARLADPNVFPNLHSVVLAGHSAGGQFVQRYAAANTERLPTLYIVANPSSHSTWTTALDGLFPGVCCSFAPGAIDLSIVQPLQIRPEGLNIYMQAAGGKFRSQYAQRRVTYLLGEKDNDPNHEADKTCPAGSGTSFGTRHGFLQLHPALLWRWTRAPAHKVTVQKLA